MVVLQSVCALLILVYGTMRGVHWTQADGWTGIEEELELAGFVVTARIFSTFVIILGNFIFTQTVIAIILLNIDYATAKFKVSRKHFVYTPGKIIGRIGKGIIGKGIP